MQYKPVAVSKGLYIGNIVDSIDLNFISSNNIKGILYLGYTPKKKEIIDTYRRLNIDHKFIKIKDSLKSNIYKHFDECYEYISKHKNNNNNILIHCMKGISRSPTIAAFYLMKKIHSHQSMKYKKVYPVVDDILDHMIEYRSCINPNKSFLKQLKLYENKSLKESL